MGSRPVRAAPGALASTLASQVVPDLGTPVTRIGTAFFISTSPRGSSHDGTRLSSKALCSARRGTVQSRLSAAGRQPLQVRRTGARVPNRDGDVVVRCAGARRL